MNNFILGSGLIGMLAKAMLGPSWQLIPFYRSRFFSFNPALDDNFIIYDPATADFFDDVCKEFGGVPSGTPMYRRSWSVGGQLVNDWNPELCRSWLAKIFGSDVPSQSLAYYTNRMNLLIYRLRSNVLYNNLINRFKSEISAGTELGVPIEITDHTIRFKDKTVEYDNILSTIPLTSMCKLMNIEADYKALDLHYFHVETNDLDFEGNSQVMVVDDFFSFYKVSAIAPSRYLFYFNREVQNPGVYFMSFLKKFDILDCTTLKEALPVGEQHKDSLFNMNVYTVGSNAQWDWCMDVGSCVLRLQRYAQRGFVPAKSRSII